MAAPKPPAAAASSLGVLSDAEHQTCSLMGISEADYLNGHHGESPLAPEVLASAGLAPGVTLAVTLATLAAGGTPETLVSSTRKRAS